MEQWLRLAIGAAGMVVIAVGVLTWFGVGQRGAAIRAALRAALQLTLVALVLRGAISNWVAAVAVVAVMYLVASLTAGRRIRELHGALRATLISCAAGATVSIGLIVGVPILSRDTRDLIAVSGIVIGGCMTASTLTGRRLLDGMRRRREEIEAWLAIGATKRQAILDVARTAVSEALIPGLDQTRTVGLVTLPGAFVGALLAGANAEQAARFQFAVLTGLICAQAITAVCLAYLLGDPPTVPTAHDHDPH